MRQNEKRTKQDNLFGEVDVPIRCASACSGAWSTMDRLTYEFNALGFFLSGHPLDDYKALLKRARDCQQFADLQAAG